MTDRLREAATAALAAIEDSGHKADLMAAAESLRAALAEPEPEPVAVGHLVSPYGEWKPNFNLKCTFPAESLEWSIPLYFHYAHSITPPASADEKVVRLTLWQHQVLSMLIDFYVNMARINNVPGSHDENARELHEALGDWPAQEGTSRRWKCSQCQTIHETDTPARASAHSPCACGSIFFEKLPETL